MMRFFFKPILNTYRKFTINTRFLRPRFLRNKNCNSFECTHSRDTVELLKWIFFCQPHLFVVIVIVNQARPLPTHDKRNFLGKNDSHPITSTEKRKIATRHSDWQSAIVWMRC